jgi:hypothetical protein
VTDRPKCQCKPGCRFAADLGQPFKLAHDNRPERQEARSAAAKVLSDKAAVARAADVEARRTRKVALRTTDDFLGELEQALREVGASGGDVATRTRVKVDIIKAAHAILKSTDLETQNAELRKLLIERHPELKKHLMKAIA